MQSNNEIQKKRSSPLSVGKVVKIISGQFDGELARVVEVHNSSRQVTVELVDALLALPVTLSRSSVKPVGKEPNDVKGEMKVALYAMVSSANEASDHEVQLPRLREYARDCGYTIIGEYVDSVTPDNKDRPGFLKLMEDARERRFDAVVVTRLQRFAHGLDDLRLALKVLGDKEIGFVCTSQSIDTSEYGGDALYHILDSIIEFSQETRGNRKMMVGMGLNAGESSTLPRSPGISTLGNKRIGRKRINIPVELLLKAYFDSGRSFKGAAKLLAEQGLGVNQSTIRHRINEIKDIVGIVERKRVKVSTEDLLKAYEQGGRTYKGAVSVLAQQGITTSKWTVGSRLKEVGPGLVKIGRKRADLPPDVLLKAYQDGGRTFKGATRVLAERGVVASLSTVKSRLKKLGSAPGEVRQKRIVIPSDVLVNAYREGGETFIGTKRALEKKGISASTNTLRSLLQNEKGILLKERRKFDISQETLLKAYREGGETASGTQKILAKQGIKADYNSIHHRLRALNLLKRTKKKVDIPADVLRKAFQEGGRTVKGAREVLVRQGIVMCHASILRKLKKIDEIGPLLARKKFDISDETLLKAYQDGGKTVSEALRILTGQEVTINRSFIYNRLMKLGIVKPSPRSKVDIPEDVLRKAFEDGKQTVRGARRVLAKQGIAIKEPTLYLKLRKVVKFKVRKIDIPLKVLAQAYQECKGKIEGTRRALEKQGIRVSSQSVRNKLKDAKMI